MKNLYLKLLLILCPAFCIPDMLCGQNNPAEVWMPEIYGTWKIDSVNLKEPYKKTPIKNEKRQPYILINLLPDNNYVVNDSSFLKRDSFEAFEFNHKKVILTDLMPLRVLEIQKNYLHLGFSTLLYKEINGEIFLQRTTASIKIPDIRGEWTNAYREDSNEYSSIQFLNDSRLILKKGSLPTEGQWTMDSVHFRILMNFKGKAYTSNIYEIDKHDIVISDPLDARMRLKLFKVVQETEEKTPKVSKNLDSMRRAIKEWQIKRDTTSPEELTVLWDAKKIVHFSDSLPYKEKVTIQFNTDKNFLIQKGSTLYKGTWRVSVLQQILILEMNGKEQVCHYDLGDKFLYKDERTATWKNQLTLTMKMPWENIVETYVFEDKNLVEKKLK
jgi:hypothetical protein